MTRDPRDPSNQTVNDGVAHSKNPRKCAYHVTFDVDLVTLTLSTPWMQAYLVTIVCKFGRDRAICLREEAIQTIHTEVYTLQTDRQTDYGRRAIALTPSWNELIKMVTHLTHLTHDPLTHFHLRRERR